MSTEPFQLDINLLNEIIEIIERDNMTVRQRAIWIIATIQEHEDKNNVDT